MAERCYRCFRPIGQCGCDEAPSISNETRVRLLQHPREARHPFGTAALLRAALHEITVDVGLRFEPPPSTDGLALLWPSAPNPSADVPHTLIAIDGTWAHARAIMNANVWLKMLPTVTISGRVGGYRARREQSTAGLATVEAVALALRRFEPDLDGCEALIEQFEARENDWARGARSHQRRRRRTRATIQRRALEDIEHAVVGYRSGRQIAVCRVVDPNVRWFGVIGETDRAQELARVLEGASALWAWRAAPFEALTTATPVRDLKTLHLQRGGGPGGIYDSGMTIEAGLLVTAELLADLVTRAATP